MENKTLVVGKIVAAHGIKGELKVLPLTDDITRLTSLKYFYFNNEKYDVESSRLNNSTVIIKAVQVTDRTAAERMKGLISVERADAAPLKSDEYYIEDLKGMMIKDSSGGEDAIVTDVIKTGETFVVEYKQGGEVKMIPFLKKYFTKVDAGTGVINADLADGVN